MTIALLLLSGATKRSCSALRISLILSYLTLRTWSDVPIIIVSARSEERDKITALDKGADDYLTKPFSVDELLARLRVIQRRLMKSENISVTEFVNGRLRIDYVSGCVHLDDEEIHLTPIEYKLLCLLAKNVGKVLTHKYIDPV